MKSFPRPRVFWSREDKPPTLHEEVFEHWLDLVGKCQIPLSARNSKGLQSRQDGVCSPNGRQYSIRGVDPGPFADRDLHPLLLKQSPPGGSHSESSGTANRRFLSLEFSFIPGSLFDSRRATAPHLLPSNYSGERANDCRQPNKSVCFCSLLLSSSSLRSPISGHKG